MPRRRPIARIGAILTAALAVVAISDLTAPEPAHAAATRVVSPGANLTAAMESLRAGDTLLLAPGTYDVGALRPALAQGLADARITVKAMDWRRPPLLRGWLRLERPYFWSFSNLRVQATLPGHEAIDVFGGRYWNIDGTEVFGARQTGAYANLAVFTWDDPSDGSSCGVSGTGPGCENPYGWSIVTSCFHDAGLGRAPGHSPGTDHNIYLTGSGYAPGRISRNILYSAPSGSQIKIGSPSLRSGFVGVSVRYNTLNGSAQGVLMAGNGIVGNSVRGNLIRGAVPSTRNGVGAGIYLAAPGRALRAGEKPNFIAHNYGSTIRTRTLYLSPQVSPGTLQQADNPTSNAPWADPKFSGSGCSGFRPRNPTAARYGRYSSYFGTGY